MSLAYADHEWKYVDARNEDLRSRGDKNIAPAVIPGIGPASFVLELGAANDRVGAGADGSQGRSLTALAVLLHPLPLGVAHLLEPEAAALLATRDARARLQFARSEAIAKFTLLVARAVRQEELRLRVATCNHAVGGLRCRHALAFGGHAEAWIRTARA